ncbi:glutamate--tRNA ligase [Candidatus Raskinella chloraquaticus]|uniref:Glutamate--tRNA ligase n=1 Tax=Candidatus Raskinella chloraquaticus TaxID=1951219 RepID=A0A1W9HXI2_9HYPH|nr:MAG: glutamate--tRNA ligase [Proteobacteria bacterium SG_bin8]
MSIPTVRFAPSPTGYLHIGNLRPALFNWLYAKAHGGRFILRYDDTDRERSTAEFADAIAADLAWIGIVPDLVIAQSDRLPSYDAAVETLKASGLLYPCYETPDELDRRRKRQQARGLPPIYDRAALNLSAEERASLEAAGRRAHWRFKLSGGDIAFNDLIRGEVHVRADTLSDPVLVREDGTYLYTLTSVVDDIALDVTHVIRGEDHVTNTGVQIEIWRGLGGVVPVFAHHNLLTTSDGEGLSKRSGALSLRSLRADGFEPMAVASLATLLGTANAVEPVATLGALAAKLDLSHISRAPAKFDPGEVAALNAKLVHGLPYAHVEERLAKLAVGGGEDFWLTIRANLVKVSDAAQWWQVATGDLPAMTEDETMMTLAADLLPPEPWDVQVWGLWANAVKAASGRSGKDLFLPLRRALTGRDHGPEMKSFLPFIGRERAYARLIGARRPA